MSVAYLINQYPMASLTFIRREIAALKDAGLSVDRYSIRANHASVVDDADRAEAQRTTVILDQGPLRLGAALVGTMLASPLRWARAATAAIRMGWCSDRGLLRHLAYLVEACALLRLLRRGATTHLHAHFGTNSATVAMLCHMLGGPPFSFTLHGPEEFDKPRFIGLKRKIEAASFVVAVSQFGRSQTLRWCGHEHWSKVHVVPCGLDRDLLESQPVPVPDEPRLVCVGRLCEQKGQLLLLEAVARLKARGVKFELILAGDGEQRPALEALIAQHHLREYVRITGWQTNAQVRQWLACSRALVLPSFAEGLPVAIMEAMAMRRPVVSTLVAGIPELVNEQCGWLIPAGSVEALTQTLQTVLDTPRANLQCMGEAAHQRVRARHDVHASALLLSQLFRRSEARSDAAPSVSDLATISS